MKNKILPPTNQTRLLLNKNFKMKTLETIRLLLTMLTLSLPANNHLVSLELFLQIPQASFNPRLNSPTLLPYFKSTLPTNHHLSLLQLSAFFLNSLPHPKKLTKLNSEKLLTLLTNSLKNLEAKKPAMLLDILKQFKISLHKLNHLLTSSPKMKLQLKDTQTDLLLLLIDKDNLYPSLETSKL